MLKRLRIKFIALTMAMITVVLACITVAICVVDRQQSVAEVYRALDSAIAMAVDQQTHASGPDSGEGEGAEDGSGAGEGEEALSSDAMQLEIGGFEAQHRENVIPLALYVQLDDGTFDTIRDKTTASISEYVLASAFDQLASASDGSGELSDLGLFYVRRTSDDGQTLLAFADAASANSWQALAGLCVAVDAGALVAFLAISWRFSKWALRPVERAWSQQRQFIVDASHELKTPLAVILANASILLKHPERSIASQSQWLESTQAEAAHMQGLVSDMIELAALDEQATSAKADQGEPERIDLSDFVEAMLLQFESVAFESSVELAGDIDPDVHVRGDRARLGRMASTIIDNALKYSDAGGSVTVSLAAASGTARLSVHNEGAPIPAEDLAHVFDRFYRADKARTRRVGGYGLGLAIAQETARSLGGDIVVSSSEGEGTTFVVTLPTA